MSSVANGQIETGRAQFVEGSEARHFGVDSNAQGLERSESNGGGRRGQGPYHGLRYQPSLLHPAAAGAFGAGRRDSVARASWAFPLVGAAVGAFGALVYWLADRLYLDPILGGILAVAATLLVTGALHEDGLGDTADGFGASASRERKLDIMRDSEIGAYGTCALILSIMLRTGALVSLAEPKLVALALIAAHAGARGTLPVFMRLVPNARRDGLSAGAGTPPQSSALMAALLGLVTSCSASAWAPR